MKVHPFRDVLQQADKLLQQPNIDIYQQFNCGTCGMKQTMAVANTFYTKGTCEVCGSTTDIEANGCNMMTVTRAR